MLLKDYNFGSTGHCLNVPEILCHMQHKQYFKKQDRFETCFKNRRMWFAFGHFWWVIGWVNKKCGSSFFGFCKFNVNVFVWSVIQLMGNGNLN